MNKNLFISAHIFICLGNIFFLLLVLTKTVRKFQAIFLTGFISSSMNFNFSLQFKKKSFYKVSVVWINLILSICLLNINVHCQSWIFHAKLKEIFFCLTRKGGEVFLLIIRSRPRFPPPSPGPIFIKNRIFVIFFNSKSLILRVFRFILLLIMFYWRTDMLQFDNSFIIFFVIFLITFFVKSLFTFEFHEDQFYTV